MGMWRYSICLHIDLLLIDTTYTSQEAEIFFVQMLQMSLISNTVREYNTILWSRLWISDESTSVLKGTIK